VIASVCSWTSLAVAFSDYLARLAPVKTLEEFIGRGEFHASLKPGLNAEQRVVDGLNDPEYKKRLLRRNDLRQAVMPAMAQNKLTAILYPHQRRLVVPIGEDQVERNGVLSNGTGFPAITFSRRFLSAYPHGTHRSTGWYGTIRSRLERASPHQAPLCFRAKRKTPRTSSEHAVAQSLTVRVSMCSRTVTSFTAGGPSRAVAPCERSSFLWLPAPSKDVLWPVRNPD
jgi:hypothetical protein